MIAGGNYSSISLRLLPTGILASSILGVNPPALVSDNHVHSMVHMCWSKQSCNATTIVAEIGTCSSGMCPEDRLDACVKNIADYVAGDFLDIGVPRQMPPCRWSVSAIAAHAGRGSGEDTRSRRWNTGQWKHFCLKIHMEHGIQKSAS